MKACLLLFCLVHSHLTQYLADCKRFDSSMVDPLMRRSSLDKNFMRFGRSSPSFTEDEDVVDNHDSSPGEEPSKEDNFLRSMKGKDNFIRFGRTRNDNFMRFGRGKQDHFMRLGRGKQDNFIRFGRGKQDNYMRFGRGKQDSYMRFGRGKQDNYMRFGRGKQDNFMRFGRGKQDNFMRFGRGKQDNFMRFGRDFEDLPNTLPLVLDPSLSLDEDLLRDTRGKQDNFMRFGRQLAEVDDDIPVALRSGNSKSGSNFIRFGRARQDNFMRFGKSDEELDPLQKTVEPNSKELSDDEFTRDTKSKDLNLIRFGRHPPGNSDAFIRFGRNHQDSTEDTSEANELIPQRLKRSILKPEGYFPSKESVLVPLDPLSNDLEEEFISIQEEDLNSRRKRSLASEPTSSPFTEADTSVNYVSAKVRFSPEPQYHSSLISAGLPNVIVGPEFSLLPNLDPPSKMLKKGRLGDQNFLRLG